MEIKNSLYYTSHSVPNPPVHPLRLLLPSILPCTVSLSSPHPSFSSSFVVPPHASSFLSSLYPSPSTHHIPPLRRRLVRADRLNMRPAIPDGTNIIKVRLHAKPVKYRRPPLFRPPLQPPVTASTFRSLATEGLRHHPPFALSPRRRSLLSGL